MGKEAGKWRSPEWPTSKARKGENPIPVQLNHPSKKRRDEAKSHETLRRRRYIDTSKEASANKSADAAARMNIHIFRGAITVIAHYNILIWWSTLDSSSPLAMYACALDCPEAYIDLRMRARRWRRGSMVINAQFEMRYHAKDIKAMTSCMGGNPKITILHNLTNNNYLEKDIQQSKTTCWSSWLS